MAEATQEFRAIELATPLGRDVLLLRRMRGSEALSQVFEFELELLSDRADIDGSELLGENVSVRIELSGGGTRYFNGFVSAFATARGHDRLHGYTMSVRPWLWFLSRYTDCRVFQEKTAVDVVLQVFRDRGFTDFRDETRGSYRTHEYIVQYRESDLNFVSRLLEYEGIYYYFEHASGSNTLVLSDDAAAHSPNENYDKVIYAEESRGRLQESLSDWRVRHEFQATSYLVDAYDFKNPKTSLEARRAVQRSHALSDLEMYDPEDRYVTAQEGDDYAQRRVDQLSSDFEVASGVGNVRGLTAGCIFSLTEHPVDAQNREYLVVSTEFELASSDFESGGESEEQFHCSIRTMPNTQQFRPAQNTPKPEISGPQSAVITGKSGEEIWTDEFGRVKVLFHWDRYGRADETSSCWVRVAQEWAGKNWGSMHLPRVGQEVLVEFIEGDPDRPIITGRLYNGENKTPYNLPDDKTKSGIKTKSSKDASGFNELRFEDKAGEEQVFIHGQKDLDIRVLNDRKEFIGANRHLIVEADRFDEVRGHVHLKTGEDYKEQVVGDRHLTVGSDDFIQVKGNENLTVDMHEKVEIGQDYSLDVGMNIHEKAGMNVATEAGLDLHLKGGMNVVVEAGVSLTLKVGGNFVNINPGGVFIQGSMVMINSGGAAGAGAGAKPQKPEAPAAPTAPEEADDAESGTAASVSANPASVLSTNPGATPVEGYTEPQAQVLAAAAESGAPFCEECERAARAQRS